LASGGTEAPVAPRATRIKAIFQRTLDVSNKHVGTFALAFQGSDLCSPNIRDWIAKATGSMREAPLTHEIVVAARELPLPHQDPADRFLAATASVLGLPLVTADHRLLELRGIATLANR
jgi:hypothetical protein